MASIISLKGWEKFQHYRDRDPPWVKLYRDLLTSESWVLGTDTSRLVQVASVLLAARYGNKIPLDWKLVRKVASLDCTSDQFTDSVKHLAKYNFLEIHSVPDAVEQDASAVLAKCSSESEQRQSRDRADTDRAAAQPEPGEFVELRRDYPKRAGSQRWHDALGAYKARVREGVDPKLILAGVRRYAVFIRIIGKERTEHVQQAATFLGKNRGFELPWAPPAKPETAGDRLVRSLNGDDSQVIEHEHAYPAITGR